MGLNNVTGIEIDSVCEENFYKNCQLSDVDGIDFKISDIHSHENYNYDVILANINKNIILKLLPRIKKNRTNQCKIILSGLLISDRDDIIDLIEQLGFKLLEENHKGEWICFVIN